MPSNSRLVRSLAWVIAPTILAAPIVLYLVRPVASPFDVRVSARRVSLRLQQEGPTRLLESLPLRSVYFEQFGRISFPSTEFKSNQPKECVFQTPGTVTLASGSPALSPSVVLESDELVLHSLPLKTNATLVFDFAGASKDELMVTVNQPLPSLELFSKHPLKVSANYVSIKCSANRPREMDSIQLRSQSPVGGSIIAVEGAGEGLTLGLTLHTPRGTEAPTSSEIPISDLSFTVQDPGTGAPISGVRSGSIAKLEFPEDRKVSLSAGDVLDIPAGNLLRLRALSFSPAEEAIEMRLTAIAEEIRAGPPGALHICRVTRYDSFKRKPAFPALGMLAWVLATSVATYKFIAELRKEKGIVPTRPQGGRRDT
jgi:hypothetical protein